MVTIKGNTYTIHTSELGDMKMLIKNDKPVLFIPEELEEDFINILAMASAANRFLNEPDFLTNKTNNNENKI